MESPSQAIALRARFLGIASALFFVACWIATMWPFNDGLDRFGVPCGGDYVMFYAAGQTMWEGKPDQLYDVPSQQRRIQALFPGIRADYCLPYRYPPFVAASMAPLASLPYAASFAIFTALSCMAWALAAWLLVIESAPTTPLGRLGPLGPLRPFSALGLWLALGWPLAWETILGGQASHVALLIVAASLGLAKRDKHVLAGIVLGCAMYKPNVLAFFGLGLCIRYPRALWGVAITGAAGLVLSLCAVGLEGVLNYIAFGSQLATNHWDLETPLWKVHSLGSFLHAIMPGHERRFLLIAGLLTTISLSCLWRRQAHAGERANLFPVLLLLVNAIANPYLPIYDLNILLAVLVLSSGCVSSSESESIRGGEYRPLVWQGFAALLAFGPHCSQALAMRYGVQLFPLALLGATILLPFLLGNYAPAGVFAASKRRYFSRYLR